MTRRFRGCQMVRVTVEKMTGESIESLSCKSGRVSWINCLTVLEIIYWQQPVEHLVFCSGKRDQMARSLYNVKCKETPTSKENYSSEQYFFRWELFMFQGGKTDHETGKTFAGISQVSSTSHLPILAYHVGFQGCFL